MSDLPTGPGRGTLTNAIEFAIKHNIETATTDNFDSFLNTFPHLRAPRIANTATPDMDWLNSVKDRIKRYRS